MTDKNFSRRNLLVRSLQLPLGGLVLAAATSQMASAEELLCADPKKMDGGQKSIRESLNYAEKSPDPAKTCGGCGFFEGKPDACGNCMIFSGPANPKGHCDSWSAKG